MFFKKEDEDKCVICGKKTKFGKFSIGYSKTCGDKYCNSKIGSITYKEKTGYDNPLKNPEILNRIEKTMIEKYGVKNAFQSEEIKGKIKKTLLEKTGYDHSSKNPDTHRKQQTNGFKFKDYKLPSGKIIKLQGYEDKALNILLEEYSEDEILVHKGVPTIDYIGEDGKTHKYFPDFYIPKDNLIIEVKSKYWYNKYIKKNEIKEKYTNRAGYKFNYMIF